MNTAGTTWHRRAVIALLMVMVAGIVLHRPLLAAVYGVLASSDKAGPVDTVVFLTGGSAWYDDVVDRVASGDVAGVLIVQPRQYRAVEISATPSLAEGIQQELIDRGVARGAITTLVTDATTPQEQVRHLQAFLEDDPGTVAVLCPEYHTTYFRSLIGGVMEPDAARRVRLWGASDAACRSDTWWQSRTGLKKLAFAYLRLTYLWIAGEGDDVDRTWDPGRYEQELPCRAPTKVR